MAVSRTVRGLMVGIVVTVGGVLFMGAILMIGQETRLFAPKYTYRTNFPDASGLRVGSPVMMAGVRIGTVSGLVLPTNPESEGIEVFLSVDKAYAARVREGTRASLVILQIVANEKAVNLTPGNPQGERLEDGAFIPPLVQEAILETGRSIATTVENIATDLREVLAAIRRGQGVLGKAIFEPEFGKEGMETVEGALESLEQLLESLNQGRGLVGRAMVDDSFATAVARDLERGTKSLAVVAERLEEGKGLLGQMTTETEADDLLQEIHTLSRSLSMVARDLEWGRGLAGRLLKDEELADRVSANLDETLANLASITRKIDEGQGTLGLLVNRRDLHDDVERLVAGVRQSSVLSWLIRRYYRKGKEALEEQQEQGSEQTEEEPEAVSGIVRPEASYSPTIREGGG